MIERSQTRVLTIQLIYTISERREMIDIFTLVDELDNRNIKERFSRWMNFPFGYPHYETLKKFDGSSTGS
jgi:hypothetical protein